jgi:hypothetical protein
MRILCRDENNNIALIDATAIGKGATKFVSIAIAGGNPLISDDEELYKDFDDIIISNADKPYIDLRNYKFVDYEVTATDIFKSLL